MPSPRRSLLVMLAFAAGTFTWPALADERVRGSDSALEACIEKANSSDPLMKDCYADFAGREDARLNRNWARLMKAVDGPKSDMGKILLTEQRAWLKFRDASCGAYAFGEGTLDRLMGVMCIAGIVSNRANQLESLSHYYDYR